MDRLAVTVPQVADMTGIGRGACYAAINSGELRAVRVGRRIVVPVAEIEAWLERRMQADSAGRAS